jgi:hypothetical protein
MIHEFMETIDTQDYCDTGFFEITSAMGFNYNQDLEISLFIQFGLISEPETEIHQCWKFFCHQVQKNNISIGFPGVQTIKLLEDHCLLWDYLEPRKSILLNDLEGLAIKADEIVGEMFVKHQSLVQQWIPFKISSKDFRYSNSLLAVDSESIINAYEPVLLEHEIPFSSYMSSEPSWFERGQGWIKERKKFQAFILGNSYIVASEIEAEMISSIG